MPKVQSFSERFKSGVAWNSVGTLALQGGTFLTNLAAANLLGVEQFGQFGLTINTSQTLAAVLQLSTGMAATRYLAQNRHVDKESASKALGLCLRVSMLSGGLGTLILALCSGFIAVYLLEAGHLAKNLLIAAPIVLFAVLSGFQVGALAGLEGFRSAAKALIALMVVQVVGVGFAAWQFGLIGGTVAVTVSFGLRSLVCHRLLMREANFQQIKPLYAWGAFGKDILYKFILPSSLTGLTAMPAMWATSVALAKSPGGFEQLAYFNAAVSIRAILMIFPWILNSFGLSLLSNFLGQDDKNQFNHTLKLLFISTFSVAAVGSLVVFLVSDKLLAVYGDEFSAGSIVLDILLISLVAESLSLALYQALVTHGRMWRIFFIIMLPRDLLILLGGLYLIQENGATGLAWAHSAAWLYTLLLSIAFVFRQRVVSQTQAV